LTIFREFFFPPFFWLFFHLFFWLFIFRSQFRVCLQKFGWSRPAGLGVKGIRTNMTVVKGLAKFLYRFSLRRVKLLIHYTFFKTKCSFRSLKKKFIDKYILTIYIIASGHVCLFVTMRPAGTGRDVFANYTGTILQVTIIIPSTRSTLPLGLGQNPPRGPTATHHLSLPGQRYQTLLTTCQTSSPVEV
jgi:hypothetical protein